jgi:hypothetical protein
MADVALDKGGGGVYKSGIALGANSFGIFSRWWRDATPDYNLLLSVISDSEIDLTWDDNYTDEDGFKIERSTNGETWAVINTTAASAESYSNTQLLSSTKYYYRVRAFKGSLYAPYSTVANATTEAPS